MKVKQLLVLSTTLLLSGFLYAETLEQVFKLDIEKIKALSPESGTVIDKSNVDTYKEMLVPEMDGIIKKDFYSITVRDPISFEPHQAYIDATIEHQGQTILGQEPGEISGYIAGRPFPEELSTDDPKAGDKLAWNMRYTYTYDSGEITDFFWHFKNMHKDVIERTLSFYASSMRFMHRHVQAPIPELPNNPSNIYSSLYLKAINPAEIRNSQYLVQRLEDDTKQEQAWLYLSAQRRVYRLPTGQSTDAFFGSDIMIEDFLGYNGRIKDQEWTFKGHVWVLLPFFNHNEMPLEKVNDQEDGYQFIGFRGKGGCFPDVTWQLRKAYVLEARPRNPDHPLSKRLFYIDAQTMLPAYGNIFDRAGKLWKIAIAGYSHPDTHHPLNKDSGTPIIDTVSMIDIQAMHCTTLQFKTMVSKEPFNILDFTPQALRIKGR